VAVNLLNFSFLISPVIHADKAEWVEVSAEIQCMGCSVSLYYFSSEKVIDNIRPNLFSSLGGAVVGFTHSIQFSLPYSLAWLMVTVDPKQKPMRLERLTLTSMSCPQVRI
jgi:hypothetical protein